MSLTVTESNTTRQPLPTGPTQGRCLSVVDLGTQSFEYKGETKSRRRILISFELSDHSVDTDEGSRPAVRSVTMTHTLHPQGRLRPFLESWRGKPFTNEQLAGFNLEAVLDKPCMLNIGLSDKGNDFIQGIMPAIAGLEANDLVNKAYTYTVDNPDIGFDKLPEWQQKIVQQSAEWLSTGSAELDAPGEPEIDPDAGDQDPF